MTWVELEPLVTCGTCQDHVSSELIAAWEAEAAQRGVTGKEVAREQLAAYHARRHRNTSEAAGESARRIAEDNARRAQLTADLLDDAEKLRRQPPEGTAPLASCRLSVP